MDLGVAKGKCSFISLARMSLSLGHLGAGPEFVMAMHGSAVIVLPESRQNLEFIVGMHVIPYLKTTLLCPQLIVEHKHDN